jgi:RHS repeat-associated protein
MSMIRTMHWSTMIGRALVTVWCVLGGTGALFAELPATPERPLRYVMVLKTPGGGASEPNVPQVGGRELTRWGARRLIEIPREAIDALSRRHDILYLALVDDGKETDAPRYVRPEGNGAALAAETNAEPEFAWDSGVYQYDGSGNITAIGAATYRYDKAQRLAKAVMGGETIEYTYDSFGNQIQRKIGTTVIPSTASPRSNRLDHAGYDRAGNQTSAIGSGEEYVYDATNMMVQRKGIIPKRYIYTADDERIGTANGAEELEWEWTVRDFSGRVMATYEAVGKNELTTWEWQESHHYRDGTLASALKVEEHVRDAHGGRHFHVDHLGTPRLITNQDRQQISAHDFHPFGKEQTRLNQELTDWGYRTLEPMKFTGHERDYTTSFDSNVHDYLDYMHARYYSPGWGRFLSVDPTWESADLGKPQSWNRYSYVMNNPINATDPDGRVGFFLLPPTMPFHLGLNHPKHERVVRMEKAGLAMGLIALYIVVTRGDAIFAPGAGEPESPPVPRGGQGSEPHAPRVKKMSPDPRQWDHILPSRRVV